MNNLNQLTLESDLYLTLMPKQHGSWQLSACNKGALEIGSIIIRFEESATARVSPPQIDLGFLEPSETGPPAQLTIHVLKPSPHIELPLVCMFYAGNRRIKLRRAWSVQLPDIAPRAPRPAPKQRSKKQTTQPPGHITYHYTTVHGSLVHGTQVQGDMVHGNKTSEEEIFNFKGHVTRQHDVVKGDAGSSEDYLGVTPEPRTCSQGHLLEPNDKFCTACGEPITEETNGT